MKIGFIGGGKMAEAILADIIATKTVDANDIYVTDINEDRLKILNKLHSVKTVTNSGLLLESVDIVFMAVKPQCLSEVLIEMKPNVSNKHLIISIAAGKNIAFIEKLLPESRVIRVMPNMAALVSEGMSVFCTGTHTTEADHKNAITLLSCSGKLRELPEEQFDAVTAVSGSGPAFFTYFLSLVIDAGEQLGLEHENAEILACQTMLGTATLLTKGQFNPAKLIETISSAKGTTIAGMEVLKNSPIKQAVYDTLTATAKRSAELSN